jgi:lipopolysaccharide export system protein LptA
VAIGNVSFTIKNDKSDLIGNGDKVTYDLENQLYVIVGNGYLEDKKNNKMIRGENIYINQKTGYTKIDGSKNKPVKFKFTIEDKKNANNK